MTFVVGSQLKREGCRRLPHGSTEWVRGGKGRGGKRIHGIEQDTRPPFLPLSHYIINRSAWHFSTHGRLCVCDFMPFSCCSCSHLHLVLMFICNFFPVQLVGLGPSRHRHCVFAALLFVIINFYGGSSFFGLSRTQCKFMPIYGRRPVCPDII